MDDWENEGAGAAALAHRDDADVADDWEAELDAEEDAARPRARAPPKPRPAAPAPYVDPHAGETPQQRKARLDALEKQRDLEAAMDLFGVGGDARPAQSAPAPAPAPAAASASPFDTMAPTTVAEFDALARVVLRRCEALEAEGSSHYGGFVESLVNGLMARRDPAELRKVSAHLADVAARRAKEISAAKAPRTIGAAKAPALKAARKAGGTLGRFNDCLDEDSADPFGE